MVVQVEREGFRLPITVVNIYIYIYSCKETLHHLVHECSAFHHINGPPTLHELGEIFPYLGLLNTLSDSASFVCSLTWQIPLLQNHLALMHLLPRSGPTARFFSSHITGSLLQLLQSFGRMEPHCSVGVFDDGGFQASLQNCGQLGLPYLLLMGQYRSTATTRRSYATFTGSYTQGT